jgi:hypothetical protein
MRTKKLLCIAIAAAAGAAQAQPPALRSYCHATPEERTVADATALMIQKASLIDNGNGTYRINATPFVHTGADPMCTTDPIYNTPQMPNGRTAFLVGSDGFNAMVTAPHAPSILFNPNNYAVVFGLHDTLVGGVCQPPNLTSIPAANVYFPPSLSALANSFSVSSPRPADYMLFQLDRIVPPAIKPLALRTSGKPDVGDPLLIVGHYNHFPTQISTGSTIQANTSLGLDIGTPAVAAGNSGSPVYNLRTKVVETVIADSWSGVEFRKPTGSTCAMLMPRPNSLRLVNNGNLADLVAIGNLPAHRFSVSPVESVLHTGTVGGAVTNPLTTFTVTPIPGPSAPTATYRIRTTADSVNYPVPKLDLEPSSSFTPTPGSAPLTFTVGAITNNVACGVYDTDIQIVENTTDNDGKPVAVIPHRFEIGVNDFSVAPTEAWTPTGFGPPFGATHSLTLKNVRATPVNVSVSSNAAWLRVNGSASATVALGAVGTGTANGTATLSIDASAGGGSGAGVTRTGKVTIASTQPECDLGGATVVDVTLKTGTTVRSAVLDGLINGPGPGQTFGPALEVPLAFGGGSPAGGYVVADVDLEVGFYSDSMFGLPITDVDGLLKLEVVAPDNTVAVVWDRGTPPNSTWYGTTTIPYGTGQVTLDTLKLDDATTPPVSPAVALSTFNGKAAEGTWKVRLYTTDSGIMPMKVQLTIKRT